MRQAWVFEGVSVLVGPWHEPIEPPERGTRVEIRLLADEPHRGSYAAAQKVVLDDPLFRADLFDQMNAPPGNLAAAHFHPNFIGVEPCDRVWDPAIKQDPIAWLTAELANLARVVTRAGVDIADCKWLEDDAAAVKAATPAICAAVEATWAEVRAEGSPHVI